MGEASAQNLFLRKVLLDMLSCTINLFLQGFFQQFWGKAPGQNCGKLIDLTLKFGEINDIEHNKGSKIHLKSFFFRFYHAKHTT